MRTRSGEIGLRMRMGNAGMAAGMVLVAAMCAGGCRYSGVMGRFEKTLKVDGAAHLELENRSGSVEVRTGAPGEVRVEGEYRLRGWAQWEGRAEDITEDPPVAQTGNYVRVGLRARDYRGVEIRYVVTVPEETEVRVKTGSGHVDVRGVKMRAELQTGSGRLYAEHVGGDVRATTGSGRIEVFQVAGRVDAKTGSGSIGLTDVQGNVEATTGSGGIVVTGGEKKIQVRTGSGSIRVEGAKDDLRARTGSGSVRVEGAPNEMAIWALRTGSGGIRIDVPEDGSFAVDLRTSSGRIRTGIPLVVEQQGKRMLRGRAGSGGARIEAETRSGGITIE